MALSPLPRPQVYAFPLPRQPGKSLLGQPSFEHHRRFGGGKSTRTEGWKTPIPVREGPGGGGGDARQARHHGCRGCRTAWDEPGDSLSVSAQGWEVCPVGGGWGMRAPEPPHVMTPTRLGRQSPNTEDRVRPNRVSCISNVERPLCSESIHVPLSGRDPRRAEDTSARCGM